MKSFARRLAALSGLAIVGTLGFAGTAHADVANSPNCTLTYAGQASGDAAAALPTPAPPPAIGIVPGTPKNAALDLAGNTVTYVFCVV